MDIAAASTLMSKSALSNAVGIKILSIAKDQAVQQGQVLARNVHLGKNCLAILFSL